MSTITFDLPDEALAALNLSAEGAAEEARRVLAVHWFDQRRISQGTGARIAGMSRHDFLLALGESKVSPIQVGDEELAEELSRGIAARRERQSADTPR